MLRPVDGRNLHSLPTYTLRVGGVLTFAILATTAALSKETGLTAIVLFDNSAGAAYVQVSGLVLNGKSELRSCSDTPRITRSNYGKLPKIQIKGARTLEVSPDGQLVLTAERGQVCVVPSNLRFDKESDFTPQDLAKQAILQGTVVSSSASHATEMPALQPGVRLVFVPA